MSRLSVAALVAGEPGPAELWTLRGAADAGCRLCVVSLPAPARLPVLGATRLLAAGVAALEGPFLRELFDYESLSAWWRSAAPPRVAPEAAAADVFLNVSGAAPGELLSRARLAALEIGMPAGPLSPFWAVVEGRPEWTASFVRVYEAGADTGLVVWRGAPQLAPGDSAPDIGFRAHARAVKALTEILRRLAAGRPPVPWAPPVEPRPPRGEPALMDWLRYLRLGAGRRARFLLERGLEC